MTTSSERETGEALSVTPPEDAAPAPGGTPPEGGRHTSDASRQAVGGPMPTGRLGLLLICGFGVLVTAGLVRDLGGRMVQGNLPDAMHYSWWLGWTVHALGNFDNPLITDTMNYPQGVSAMNNTTLLLPAVLLAPVTVLAGPLVSLNLLNVLAIPLCAVAAYWSARRIGLRPAASLAAAAAFALSPSIVNSLVGHVTMALAPAMPVIVALSVDAWRGREGWTERRTGLVLGGVATAQVFVGEEVLFQAGLAATIVVVVAALSCPRAVRAGARRLARTLAWAFAVFLPITAYPLYLQFFGDLSHHGNPFLKDYYAADLTAFWTPTERLWWHDAADVAKSAKFPGGIEEHLAFLGWPLIITCVALTLWRWRDDVRVRCAAVGLALAAVLSLGGRLWVGGVWTQTKGPYALLQELPVIEASLASRLGLLAALFSAAMLGLAVDGVLSSEFHWRRPAALALGMICLLPILPRPLTTVPAPEVPEYFAAGDEFIKDDPVLVVLPYPWAGNPVAMRWQSESGYRFRMPGGYFLGPGPDGHAYVSGGADPATAQLLTDVANDNQAAAVTDQTRAQAQADLRSWGADAVVLGPDGAQDALRTTVTDLLGRQPERVGGVDVWRLSP
jgi:hypothetical protein